MLKKIGIIAIGLTVFAACNNNKKENKTNKKVAVADNNPLMQKSTLPFQAPPFDKIKDSDFVPAFEAGMKQQMEEIEKIANNKAAPTFQNTLVAMEKDGQLLGCVQQVFAVLTGANTDPKLQKIQQEMAPKLSAHYDAIYLNDKLFQRVKTIYDNRNTLKLDSESLRLVEYYYKNFVRAGANLSAEDKAKLKELNKEASKLSSEFGNRLLNATKAGALVISDKSLLKGLSESQLKTAKQNAENRGLKEKWVLTLQNTTQQPLLQNLDNRAIRKELFLHSWNRTAKGDSNDTRAIIIKLAKVRAEKAKLLGFPNYAAWKLQNQMAKNPKTVFDFLDQLVAPAKAKAKADAAELQKLIDSKGKHFELQPWDWNYYAEMLRKKKYNLNTDSVRPYFELNNVLQKGVFFAAHQLYGLTFKERHDIPVWHDGVRVFDVIDKNGSPLGLFYCDYFKRDNKSGGAWMDNIVTQSHLLNQKPVIYNVLNIPKPAKGEPALLTFDEVTTMFHEFGHALHGFFANQQYPSLSGTSVARDFVEFPSQFNENWASYPEVFKNYAVNYKTGKPMPKELVEKIKKSKHFNQGYAVAELLEAALLDMKWHTISDTATIKDVSYFEVKSLKAENIYIPVVPPRYRSSYFNHIWANGYSAGYYAYIWTHMLAANAFDWFEKNGGMTRKNGQRFRDMILSQGNTKDLSKIFDDFVGHKPEVAPLLQQIGLK